MAASLISAHFALPHNAYSRHTQLPQPPPSPPMEDARCSLPSISKLLGLADAGSPVNEASPTSQVESPRAEAAGATPLQCRQESSYSGVERRPDSGYVTSLHHQQRGLPPTPPMVADASFDGYSSPLSKPSSQPASASAAVPGRLYETTPPLDDFRRHQLASSTTPHHPLRHSFSGPFPGPQAVGGAYYPSPMLAPASSHPQISNLFYQQPLPQAFSPLSVPVVVAPSGANPWQHHHYLAPSQGAGYPQNQDRYICQTCNKAFSRPSSLRIHSHSHTGEKPFKCTHAGCGKAFSVRSNMKRHERGCHSFDSGRRSSHAT